MTRLNLVPCTELSDQHLFAEFREIKMVPMSLRRSIAARGELAVARMIPSEYTLGKGHVTFFYDKGAYLRRRYDEIRAELRARGVRFNEATPLDRYGVQECAVWSNDYTPTPAALRTVRQRIESRIALRPGWYRHTRNLLE